MVSKTKYQITLQKIREIFDKAGFLDVDEIKSLDSGEFNSVFRVKTKERDCVIKISPLDESTILGYEKDMIESEIEWYRLIKKEKIIKTPEIYYMDFSKNLVPTSYFIMERIEGPQLNKIKLTKQKKIEMTEEIATIAASLHKIKGEKFGYPQLGLYEDWHLAIKAMTESLIKDANKKNIKSDSGYKLLGYIDKYKDILKKVESCLVNFDLFYPNFLVCDEGIALIDPERSFYGDRIADFVCIEMVQPFSKKTISIDAYNKKADQKIIMDRFTEIRYAVCLGYLGVLMDIEKNFRYSPKYIGYWRNLLMAKVLLMRAFDILK